MKQGTQLWIKTWTYLPYSIECFYWLKKGVKLVTSFSDRVFVFRGVLWRRKWRDVVAGNSWIQRKKTVRHFVISARHDVILTSYYKFVHLLVCAVLHVINSEMTCIILYFKTDALTLIRKITFKQNKTLFVIYNESCFVFFINFIIGEWKRVFD